jgi:hypothetical protein
MGLHLMELQG